MPSRMKCFKSFFKHTWRPQQVAVKSMECTTGFRAKECRNNDTELGELKVVPAGNNSTISGRPADRIPCRNGGCTASRNRVDPRSESPWHYLKTIYLVSVIVAFIVWLIVHVTLTHYEII